MSCDIKEISSSKCFGGHQKVYEHLSEELKCTMKFSIYIPSVVVDSDATKEKKKLPAVFFLAGLTRDEQAFIIQSGFQRYAEEYELVVIGTDTSPRNTGVPGESDSPYIGTGASFYVDATQEPWNKNYRMYSYITKEMLDIVEKNFSFVDISRIGISGHSMGGHGALVCYLRNPQIYKAVSAFAPVSNPVNFRLSRKCFEAYLGSDETAWSDYDATELVKRNQPQKNVTILIDQGTDDEYESLMPALRNFKKVCQSSGQPIEYNEREGFNHGYHFVSSFIGNHMKYFADILHGCNQVT